MKEKIIEICKAVEIHIQKSEEYQACIGMGRFTERFNEIIHVLNPLINQEVEKRIAERMPSEEEMESEIDRSPADMAFAGGFAECYEWLRSRLVSQKTEGGGE